MAGLVGYESSDEDEDVQEVTEARASSSTERRPENGPGSSNQAPSPSPAQPPSSAQPSSSSAQPSQPPPGPALGPTQGPSLGPALGPSLPDSTQSIQPGTLSALSQPPNDSDAGARSPYSSTRALIQDLTLPAVPSTAIPASPPGSPPAALTSKFDAFLDLKRGKGVHFNARLSASAAARNPALTDKLLEFTGMETGFASSASSSSSEAGGGPGGWQQYATTLPAEVWDPSALPAWAYKTALRRAQERARGAGEPVEFVSAGAAMVSEVGDRTGTPGTGTVPAVTGKRKTRFDER